jgi:hypothetical protein
MSSWIHESMERRIRALTSFVEIDLERLKDSGLMPS